jgi:hypothetical protein
MDSPFASRLDSNYFATHSESLEIQSLLELSTSRLEDLSTQLQELDKQTTKIRNEQSSLLLFIFKHRGLISPIRKLPIDILQEIFIACLPAHNPLMSRWEPPILLTHICSSWRNIALATPQLWKSIRIDIPFGRKFSSTWIDRSELLQEWLSRSAACPLDIYLVHWRTCDLEFYDDIIIDSLIRFSERWREVRFLAPSLPFQALVPITSLPPSKVPLLETFILNCEWPQPGPTTVNFTQLDPQSVFNVLKAPNLRDLSLPHINENVTRLPINWSQLTNISLEGTSRSAHFLSVSETYKLLSLCRNLITCKLEIGSETGDSEELPLEITTTALVSLPFLTRLSVREYASLSRLFTLLRLPSLNYIEFHTKIRPTQQSSISLLSLLTCFHNMIQLITDSRYFTRQDFIKCLRLCPLLKALTIRQVPTGTSLGSPRCVSIDDAFLKLFFESSNYEGYLCPHLEVFDCLFETAVSDTTLLQFVREKNGDSTTGIAKLEYLSIKLCRRLSDIIKQELQPYRQAGLVLTAW